MTKETQANSDAGVYSYDGDGRRVKRIVGTTETWQVYGIGDELLAEYAANTAAASPQKEYGYRNGQLLITATAGSNWGTAPTLHDNPLVVNDTTVQARHITELRAKRLALPSQKSARETPLLSQAVRHRSAEFLIEGSCQGYAPTTK
jgi:hypothetical protein